MSLPFVVTRPNQQVSHNQSLQLLFNENIYWRELWIDYLQLSPQAYDCFCHELQQPRPAFVPFNLNFVLPEDDILVRDRLTVVLIAHGDSVIQLIFGARYLKRWLLGKTFGLNDRTIEFFVWNWSRLTTFTINVNIFATNNPEDICWEQKVPQLIEKIIQEQKVLCLEFTCKLRIRHIYKALLDPMLHLPSSIIASILLYFPNVDIMDASHCVSSRTRLAEHKKKKRKHAT